MVRRKGFFVQAFKPLGPAGYHQYVEVCGRMVSKTVSAYSAYNADGWFYMSRELRHKDAVKYAKEYRNAGFPSRVVFRGNSGYPEITDEFALKR